MSVWYCIPSKKPAAEAQACVDLWRSMGYKVALFRDEGDELVNADYLLIGQYPGYAKAVNALSKEILAMDPACDWIVAGGDDTEPDRHKHAETIARECSRHFGKCDILDHGDAEKVASGIGRVGDGGFWGVRGAIHEREGGF